MQCCLGCGSAHTRSYRLTAQGVLIPGGKVVYCVPEVGLQPLKTQAQRAARVSSCHLSKEGFQGLPLQQLHKSLPLHMTLTMLPICART